MADSLVKEDVERMVDELGRAVSAGDHLAVAEFYILPALFLSDSGSQLLRDRGTIATMFEEASGWYGSKGITSTVGEITGYKPLTAKIAFVEVQWPGFDGNGEPVDDATETSCYLVELGADGKPRVRAGLTKTAT